MQYNNLIEKIKTISSSVKLNLLVCKVSAKSVHQGRILVLYIKHKAGARVLRLTYSFWKRLYQLLGPLVKKVCKFYVGNYSHYCFETSGETATMYFTQTGIGSDFYSYYFCFNDEIHLDNLKCGPYKEALAKCGPAIMTPNVCSSATRNKLRNLDIIKTYYSENLMKDWNVLSKAL